MASNQINYASYSGIDSFAAACLFAVLWVPLLPIFILRSIQRPTYVHIITALFCAVRITSFVMRAYISKSSTAAHDSSLNIAYIILFNVGFFGILYSAYICVLDREESKGVELNGILARVVKSRHLIRIILIVAVALGITGATGLINAKSESDVKSANDKRDASVYIFLGVTALLALLILIIGRAELSTPDRDGSRRYFFLLVILTGLLLVREVFLSATTDHRSEQTKEALWYPLVALPEILAVCILAVPGIVPPKPQVKNVDDPTPLQEQPSHAYYTGSQRV